MKAGLLALAGLLPLAANPPAAFYTTYRYTAYTVYDFTENQPPTKVPGVGGTLTLRPDGTYDKRLSLLLGDSGQHDPELYARIVSRHPGRVRAVYIRDVTAAGPGRAAEVAALAVALNADGGHLVLATDSRAIAEDAARLGLIARGLSDEAVPADGVPQ